MATQSADSATSAQPGLASHNTDGTSGDTRKPDVEAGEGSALSQALYYGIGIVLMKGVSLLMMPYVTRHLAPQEYGLLETLVVLADIGTIIIGFGLVEALYRFVGEAGGRRRQQLVGSCLALVLFITALSLLLLLLFDDALLAVLPAQLSHEALWLIAVPTLAEGFIAIPLTLMRMQSMARQFCVFNVIKVVVQALLVIALLESGHGMMAVLWAGAISSVLMVLLLLRFSLAQARHEEQVALSWSALKTLGRYGGPIVVSRLGLFAITGLDRWLLAERVGVEELAIYAIATKFALVLGLLMQPFALWWFPHRFQLLQHADGRQQCAHFALLGTNVGIYLAAAMMMVLPSFLLLILPQSYHLAATVVVWLALVNAIKNAGDLMNLGCFSGDSSQAQMWIQWLCALVAITGYFWLVEDYGIRGAVAVLLLVYSLRLLLFYIISQRRVWLPYRHSLWLVNLTLCAVAVLLTQVLSSWLVAWLPGYVSGPYVLGLVTASGCVVALVLLLLLFRSGVFPLQFVRRLLKLPS